MSIGFSAFEGCTSLTKIEIPEGCEIGHDAFRCCIVLETIVISERDIERLSASDIFPKPLNQYNIELKKEERSVARFVPERYKKLAHSIYDSAKEKGITPVAVKIFIPIFFCSGNTS